MNTGVSFLLELVFIDSHGSLIPHRCLAFYFAPSVVKINQEIRNLQSAITMAKKTKKGAFMEAATNNLETYLSERSVLREAMLEVGHTFGSD